MEKRLPNIGGRRIESVQPSCASGGWVEERGRNGQCNEHHHRRSICTVCQKSILLGKFNIIICDCCCVYICFIYGFWPWRWQARCDGPKDDGLCPHWFLVRILPEGGRLSLIWFIWKKFISTRFRNKFVVIIVSICFRHSLVGHTLCASVDAVRYLRPRSAGAYRIRDTKRPLDIRTHVYNSHPYGAFRTRRFLSVNSLGAANGRVPTTTLPRCADDARSIESKWSGRTKMRSKSALSGIQFALSVLLAGAPNGKGKLKNNKHQSECHATLRRPNDKFQLCDEPQVAHSLLV